MRPIVIVLIVLALGTAGIAAFLVSQFLASQTPAPTTTATQTGTQNVLVAARDIVPGTVLTPDDIRWEPWPETLIDQRFVVQPAQDFVWLGNLPLGFAPGHRSANARCHAAGPEEQWPPPSENVAPRASCAGNDSHHAGRNASPDWVSKIRPMPVSVGHVKR